MKTKILSLLLMCLLTSPILQIVSSKDFNENIDPQGKIEGSIVDMIEQIDESLVFHYHDDLMGFGSRYTGTINCTLAGQYIFNEFGKMGLDVEFHDWKYDRFESRNIVATLHGNDNQSNAIFIMSAHYDCTPGSLGANDDGSGVAAVLATAEILSQYSFNHTIRFIAFSGEEVGTYGSFSYAHDCYRGGENIVAVINADMIGYADTEQGGKFLRIHFPERSEWISDFAISIADKYMDIIDLAIEKRPNYIGADHQAFIDYGYDGVWIAHHDGYPWGNTPEDTPDHLNWTYQTKATKLLLAIIAEIAQKPIDIQIVLTTPYEGYGYVFNRTIIPLDLGRYWYKGLRGITLIFGRAYASVDVYSTEEIEYVVFCIDDNFIFFDSEPPYEWKIQGKHYPPIGKITLKVYVYTMSGKVATDEMDIRIFTLSCQYGKW
jgi:hypothetical protein